MPHIHLLNDSVTKKAHAFFFPITVCVTFDCKEFHISFIFYFINNLNLALSSTIFFSEKLNFHHTLPFNSTPNFQPWNIQDSQFLLWASEKLLTQLWMSLKCSLSKFSDIIWNRWFWCYWQSLEYGDAPTWHPRILVAMDHFTSCY